MDVRASGTDGGFLHPGYSTNIISLVHSWVRSVVAYDYITTSEIVKDGMSNQLPVDLVIILNLTDEGIIDLILEMDIVKALPLVSFNIMGAPGQR